MWAAKQTCHFWISMIWPAEMLTLLQNVLLNGLIPHWILWFACYIPSSPVSVIFTFVYELSVHLGWRQQECILSCRAPNPQQSALGGIWEKTQEISQNASEQTPTLTAGSPLKKVLILSCLEGFLSCQVFK